MKFIPPRVNILLFLLSKGGKVKQFVDEKSPEAVEFFRNQFLEGKAFLLDLIEEFKESVVASAADSNAAIEEKADALVSSNMDFAARCSDMHGKHSARVLVSLAANDPQALIDIIDYCGEQFTGATADRKDGHLIGLPDDFNELTAVVADSTEVADHVPTGEERERYDELTGAGEGEIVAVLDTGVDTDHPDLEGKILGVFSEVPGESGEDINGHGTHVFGTCCGPAAISLSHKAKGISIKVLGGREGSGLSSWIEKGLLRALAWRGPNGERVTHINMSIGGAPFHAGTERALALCTAAGIIIFAAAGNDGWRRNVDLVNNPARSIHTIGVGALTVDEDRAAFTSPGPLVDEASQGVGVLSSQMGGGRVRLDGTSMASPLSCSKSMSNQSFHVRQGFARLEDTADHRAFVVIHGRDILEVGEDDTSGSGVFDVYDTLLERKPDDVTLLAVGRRSKAAEMLAACLMFVLMMFGGSAIAQDAPTLDTTVTVYEQTEVKFGDVFVEPTKTRIVGTPTTNSVPATAIEVDSEAAIVVGSDLQPVEKKTIDGSLLLADPGEYLVFPSGTMFKRVTVQAPEPQFDVAPLVERLANTLNDPATVSLLLSAYQSSAFTITDPSVDLDGAKLVVQTAVVDALSRRPWESQRVDWTNEFRRPVQAELDRLGVADVAAYRLAVAEIIKGLIAATASEPSAQSTPIGFDNTIIHCPGRFCPPR